MTNPNQQSPQENSPFWKTFLLNASIWCVIAAILYGVINYGQTDQSTTAETVALPDKTQWSTDLEVCNQVETPAPSDAFDACKALADDDWLMAQMRLAWLYSRDSEFRDWQQAFNYVNRAGQLDRYAQLFSYVLLYRLGEDEFDKEKGEKGIKALSNIGFPAAQAYHSVMLFRGDHQLEKTTNPTYLLEDAFATGDSLVSIYEMTKFYANGFSGRASYLERAFGLLDQAAQTDFPVMTNNVAWYLATLEENPLSDSQYPLELARRVISDEEYQDNFAYVDTLAATYAYAGYFEKAAEYQTQAIELIDSAQLEEKVKQAHLAEFEQRLTQYQDNQKAVTDTISVPYEEFFNRLYSNINNRLVLKLAQATYPPQ